MRGDRSLAGVRVRYTLRCDAEALEQAADVATAFRREMGEREMIPPGCIGTPFRVIERIMRLMGRLFEPDARKGPYREPWELDVLQGVLDVDRFGVDTYRVQFQPTPNADSPAGMRVSYELPDHKRAVRRVMSRARATDASRAEQDLGRVVQAANRLVNRRVVRFWLRGGPMASNERSDVSVLGRDAGWYQIRPRPPFFEGRLLLLACLPGGMTSCEVAIDRELGIVLRLVCYRDEAELIHSEAIELETGTG